MANDHEVSKVSKTPPSRWPLVLGSVWIVVSVVLVAMLVGGVRESEAYPWLRHGLHAAYVAVLLLYLGWTRGRGGSPPPRRLDETATTWWQRLAAVAVAVVFAVAVLLPDGNDWLMLVLMLGSLVIVAMGWRNLRLRWLIQGLAVALIAYGAGLPMARQGFLSETAHVLLPAFSLPMFVAGALLVERTGFGGLALGGLGQGGLGQGKPSYRDAAAGFLRGVLLFVPLGLVNAAGGSPGDGLGWVDAWWMPLALPWFSALAEEVWFRLLLVGLVYALLRPALARRPAVAAIAAVLFSGITFGLGHGRSIETLMTTGLLYGVPMAAVFARRDFEHAVGAHYVINMIPWLMVFLAAS